MNAHRAAQLVEAGLWLQTSGDVEGARRLFEQALKLDPTNARAQQLVSGDLQGARSQAPWDSPPGLTRRDPGEDGPVEHTTLPMFRPPAIPPAVAIDPKSAWDSPSSPGFHISSAKPGLGDVMDMVAEPVDAADPGEKRRAARDRKAEVETLIRGAKDLLELDDHSGAIELILKAEHLSPEDSQVIELKARSEQTLEAMFESRLGPMSARPRVLLKDDEIIWLNLDHRAGFVLAQIDGTVSFEDLFEVCGMSRLDTARILAQLVDEGVISAR